MNSRANREKVAYTMFEQLGVREVFIQLQAVLSLYASGRTTGLFLDSGDGVSHTVPIFSGFAMPHAMARINFAGRDLTAYLAAMLTERGHGFISPSELEIVRIAKEALCYASMDFDEDVRKAEQRNKRRRTSGDCSDNDAVFSLRSGSSITLGSERFRVAEALFQPHLAGKELPGIQDMVCQSISKCDMDLRKDLYEGIVLSGGSTMFLFFAGRLEKELKATCPPSIQQIVKVLAPQDRTHSVWKGGARIASMDVFKKSWISKEEYLRQGPTAVHRCSLVWSAAESGV